MQMIRFANSQMIELIHEPFRVEIVDENCTESPGPMRNGMGPDHSLIVLTSDCFHIIC